MAQTQQQSSRVLRSYTSMNVIDPVARGGQRPASPKNRFLMKENYRSQGAADESCDDDEECEEYTAANLFEDIYAHNQARSMRSSRSQGIYVPSRTNTPALFQRDQALDDRINKFLDSIPTGALPQEEDHQAELLAENQSLQQRIAALQRTEGDLLSENQRLLKEKQSLLKGKQDLSQQYVALKKHYEIRKRQWQTEIEEMEDEYEARITDLQQQLFERGEELRQAGRLPATTAVTKVISEPSLSAEDISSWMNTRSAAWREWAQTFAHRSSNRLRTGLHPVQMAELCLDVNDFVRLRDNGSLPEELLNVRSTGTLLYGMLSNFITQNTLESPFWIFTAIQAANDAELISPCLARDEFTGMSPMWNSNNTHPPVSASKSSGSARLICLPPLTTGTTMTLSPQFEISAAMHEQEVPGAKDMENLYSLLMNVQRNPAQPNKWRSQLVKMLSEGGLSLNSLEEAKTDESRMLFEARQAYARKLKDKFLGGAARFLLQDQSDITGIEKLEARVLYEIDQALRFSCQVWSQENGWVRLRGLRDLPAVFTANSKTTRDVMEVCRAQTAQRVQPSPEALQQQDSKSIIMVLQPAIELVTAVPTGKQDEEVTKISTKAQVLIAAPAPIAAPLPKAAPSATRTVISAAPVEAPALKVLPTPQQRQSPPPRPAPASHQPTQVVVPAQKQQQQQQQRPAQLRPVAYSQPPTPKKDEGSLMEMLPKLTFGGLVSNLSARKGPNSPCSPKGFLPTGAFRAW